MKIAIVSCYNEGEGNSEYTKALEKEFMKQGHQVVILRLPFYLFGAHVPALQKKADDVINDIIKTLKNFDYVNIQYEALLFGFDYPSIKRRVTAITEHCSDGRFSITFHKIDFNKKLKKKSKIKTLFKKRSKKVFCDNPDDITISLLELINRKKGLAIFHTLRDKEKSLAYFPGIKAVAHPLNYQRKEDLENLVKTFSRHDYCQKMGILQTNTKNIGVLGTITPLKDYETVFRALGLLPQEYHLYIFGGQHKLSFSNEPEGLDLVKQLQKIVQDLELTERIHFMGFQPQTEDMIQAQLFCEYIVLPYKEFGEAGSGVAGNALETCDYVFATRNHCFDELKHFCGEAFFSFDMGNYMELAEKIRNLPDQERIKEARAVYLAKYNITENAKLYLSCLGETV